MLRPLISSCAVLALLVASLAAENKPNDAKAGRKKTAQKNASRALRFEIDQLLHDYDKNKDGHLDRKEVPAFLRDHFDQLDLNKDGKLSREELEKGAVYLQKRRRPSQNQITRPAGTNDLPRRALPCSLKPRSFPRNRSKLTPCGFR